MCGSISGFHALVSSGTTPKMIDKESQVRPIGYGAMLMEMGQPKQALPVLQDGVSASPNSMIVNFELGRVLLSLGQAEQAQHFLLLAENLAPEYAQTHYLLGRIYNQQNHAHDSEQEFKTFQELDKDPANREFPITDR